MSLPLIIMTGTLVDDPELKYTPTGHAVAKFRVACNDRRKNKATGEWEDGETTFLSCTVWRDMAENVAESLQRGMKVNVTGKLAQRSYETREGEKRTVYEVIADSAGPDLRWAHAKVAKTSRSTPGQEPQQQGQPAGGNGRGGEDPWAAGGAPDEPPF